VDWIDVAITTVRATQFQWIQGELRRILKLPEGASEMRVDLIDKSALGPNSAGHRFKIRLHDAPANSLRELRTIVSKLGERFVMLQPVEVVGIEIALDFYNRGNGDLRVMTASLQSRIAAYDDVRQYSPATGKKIRRWHTVGFDIPEVESADPDATLYIGQRTAPVQWRVYLKRTDNNQAPLAPSAHRARAEFTLNDAWLQDYAKKPAFLLEDLARLRFEDLAGLLHFRRFKPVAEIIQGKPLSFAQVIAKMAHHTRGSVAGYPFGRLAFLKDDRTGKPRNRGHGKLLEHSSHTVGDEELNRLVRDRLKALTVKFRT
jgi:hypothetical protein